MHLTSAQVRDMTAETLREFLELAIPEGRHIDYKLRLSGNDPEAQKLEFLKDISAFANSDGGDLIIGALEPVEGRSVAEQLRGIERGDEVAHRMERAASSSIDPRIAGLQIRPITLGDDGFAILVHVPPSMARPHMVTSPGNRGFYIRHTESSQPMSTHEIREAVLATATAGAIAREYLIRYEDDVRRYGVAREGQPTFLLQAVPLVAPDEPWDVTNEAGRRLLRDGGAEGAPTRSNFFARDGLRPTIAGIEVQRQVRDQAWVTELHRNGYISAAFTVPRDQNSGICYLYSSVADFFFAFARMCQAALIAFESDSPYVFRCKFLNATGVVFLPFGDVGESSAPYEKDEIEWPDYIRLPGVGFQEAATIDRRLLYNAFGFDYVD